MGFHRGVGGNPRQYRLKARNGKVREIVHKLFADATTHCSKGVQLVEKAGI
jgi:hypothetical protein